MACIAPLSLNRTRITATPPGWNASPSQVNPNPTVFCQYFPDSLLVPIFTPGWRGALRELSDVP